MRRLIVLPLMLLVVACAQNQATTAGGEHGSASGAAAGMQHRTIKPEKVEWKDAPPSLPPGAKAAMLEGDSAKEGFFALRLMMPDGYQIPPHFHPGAERLTVISGTFHLGTGQNFDHG